MLLILLCHFQVFAQNLDSLKAGFKNPPASAWPRTWWHWTKSNITKEGITKDLEWMKRSGIAGFQLADVNAGSGQTVTDPIIFGSPQWLDAVHHTAAEADRLGLEMAVFSSAGWSLTGGTWVKPEQAMKKLVWSEVQTEGSRAFSGKLPMPPSGEGPGPDLPNTNKKTGGFYRDFAVIAFRTPGDEENNMIPQVISNRGKEDGSAIMDNDATTLLTVRPTGNNGNPWIQLNYERPFAAKAITIAARRGIPVGRILASDDGTIFRTLTAIPGKSGYRGGSIRTYTFPESNARYYRVEFTNAAPRPADVISEATTPADTAYALSEIKLHSGARINRWQDKAGFNFLFEYSAVPTPEVAKNSSIDPSAIIDLTGKMNADGTLKWNIPEGKWTIMRFGYALTGAKNRPAIPAALGYEVDKMNPEHVTAYMKAYTEPLKKSLGELYGKRLQYFLMDSWEAGIQNWTDIMPDEFKKRRGYDLIRYLPALTGRVMQNAETSDRFLWDFRRTLADLIAENHYGVVTDFLHKQGVKTYGEAGGVSLESIEDALLNKKYVDIPMGEFWVRDLHPSSMYYEDVRGAASASHVYGQNLVAAEAFTGGNFESPQTLKNISDYWFTQGVNRLVFHTSAHQPLDTKPGNAMVGTHLHRNITWAENVKPLTTYFARNSFMLQ
ncbi:MAG TPA: glycosyl hydrolase, partial [Flavitalea sp.]|nr:glycosyl hydrolase [Flavitalea sp.]